MRFALISIHSIRLYPIHYILTSTPRRSPFYPFYSIKFSPIWTSPSLLAKILVYPNGVGSAWAGANYSVATVPEDLQFISTWHLRQSYQCNRVHSKVRNSNYTIPSLSIGGGFVNTIACGPVSGKFAAFAADSGSFYTDNGGGAAGHTPAHPATRDRDPRWERHGRAVRRRGRAGRSLRSLIGGFIFLSAYSPLPLNPLRTPSPFARVASWLDSFSAGAETDMFIFYRLSRWATRNGCTGGNTTETLFSGDVHHSGRARAR
ncbi:hypothetical protein DFH08DRAFT_1026021 [Mycena albidolilacea]|uniref:Uncharacterized protein n=1 Tax=Mycena albidolilacea TaxID=1033008 RepID=A0AAD7EJP3_9AGAR|nr:hypothetical protein DFH08DRAFT_1026021 [Mycena albidolilacea]